MPYSKEDIQNALKPVNAQQLATLSKKQLIQLFLGEQKLRIQAQEIKYKMEGLYIKFKRIFLSSKTEKSPSKSKKPSAKKGKKRSSFTKKPSERSPDTNIQDFEVSVEGDVECEHCGDAMKDSGLRDTSEVITVIPKDYIIQRHHHVQYKCTHCSHLKTTPRAPRVKPGSSYSDEMIVDVAMSKYCDLIPMNRYSAMARRESMIKLPPNSLIELTHYLAHFCEGIEESIRKEALSKTVLRADETTHRMFEHEKKNWYLWGFSSETAAFYECHPSRSGDVAANILKKSSCKYLMSDVYSGYSRAIKINNKETDNLITETFCNAHARRKFKTFEDKLNEFSFIIRIYSKIYKLEKEEEINRAWQGRYFRLIKRKCEKILNEYSAKSEIYKAMNYFLKNYEGLTLFTQVTDVRIPIDNNSQERLLRSAVIGRKTWLGTHSLAGAKTAATLFTIIESCKLNKVNPRDYLRIMISRIHRGVKILTPSEAIKDFPQIAWQGSPPRKKD